MNIRERDFGKEFIFKTSRSGGKGGQNVNKVSTKVELSFPLFESQLLSEDEKNLIFQKLGARISKEGHLQIISQQYRTQLANKNHTIHKFYELIEKALTPKKKRHKTKPSKGAVESRLKKKKEGAEKKERRKKIF